MKPTRPKSERLAEQIDRGLAAQRLLDDDLIASWFEAKRTEFTEAMLAAPISDDETRRAQAISLKLLAELKGHIEATAAQGERAAKEQDRSKANV